MAPFRLDSRSTLAGLGVASASGAADPHLTTAQQVQLRDLALDHIQQGVCVFDERHLLLLFNRQYADLYRIDPGEIRLGMTLREVIDLRYAAGTGPDMLPAEYAAWRERVFDYNRVIDTEVTLRDGRVLSIHHEPTDAGGWVSCHDDITARRRAEAHIHHMAHHDALTALANRAHFIDQLEKTLSRLRGNNLNDHRPCPGSTWALAVLFLDLDHFKNVNDTLGHAAGDELLRLAAARVISAVSLPHDASTSEPGYSLVARLGGDEFAILLECCDGPENATLVAQTVIDVLSTPFRLDRNDAQVGVSIGVAICTGKNPELTPTLLLSQADMALYRSKTASRGGYQVFTPALAHDLQARPNRDQIPR